MNEDRVMVELTSVRAMIYVSENAVEALMTFTVYENGKLNKVEQKMDMHELQEAIRKAGEGYIDEDDRFALADEGRAWLEEMERKQAAGWPYDSYEG